MRGPMIARTATTRGTTLLSQLDSACSGSARAVSRVGTRRLLHLNEAVVASRRGKLELQLTSERPRDALERVPTRRADIETLFKTCDGRLARPDSSCELGLSK